MLIITQIKITQDEIMMVITCGSQAMGSYESILMYWLQIIFCEGISKQTGQKSKSARLLLIP